MHFREPHSNSGSASRSANAPASPGGFLAFGGLSLNAAAHRSHWQSAKGVAARRQGRKELASLFGGAPDTATILRVFLKKKHTPPATEMSEKYLLIERFSALMALFSGICDRRQ